MKMALFFVLNLQIGWQYHFNSKWAMTLSYSPSISYAQTWEYPFPSVEPNYQWKFYELLRGLFIFSASFLYYF